MRLHDRYLFREFLAPLAFCLGGLMILVVASDAFTRLGELQERKLHGWEIVAYLAMDAPAFLVQVLPFALLVAVLAALTQHAKHNEITALRAAGVSLWRLCLPYFIVGLAATAGMFWLNESMVPRCTAAAESLLHRHVQKEGDRTADSRQRNLTFYNGAAHRLWSVGEYRPNPPELIRITLSWPPTNSYLLRLDAESARFTNDVWVFHNVHEYSQANLHASLVPLRLADTNELVLPDFTETPRQIASEVKLAQLISKGGSRSADIPLADLNEYLKLHPNLRSGTDPNGNRLLTKFYGRLAAPFTCLVVVLIAIPFGAPAGRRNLFFGVAGSIFICFAYYVVQSTSMAFGMDGLLPGWLAAWLPNILFGGLGVWLTTRVR